MWLVHNGGRFPLACRAGHLSSQRLDGFGGEVVIACVCAVVTALWQGTHEAQTPTHLLIAGTVWDLALAGIVGATGGLLLVRGAFFGFELVRYPLSGYEDRNWAVGVGLGSVPGVALLLLVSNSEPPVHLASLANTECLIIDPEGKEERIPHKSSSIKRNQSPPGCARYAIKLTGVHEIRWFGSTRRGRLYEIARGRYQLQAAESNQERTACLSASLPHGLESK